MTLVTHERRRETLILTLDRSEKKNALNGEMLDALLLGVKKARDDTAIRLLLIRGEGSVFCAGGDLKEMAQAHAGGQEQIAKLNRRYGEVLEAIATCPCVTLSLLQGAALGGGFGIACVTDIAAATRDCRMGMPEVTLGLLPAQILPFVRRRAGDSVARYLALSALKVDGTRALELGLVHEVVADAAALHARGEVLMQQIQKCAPLALRKSKSLLEGESALSESLDAGAFAFAEATLGEGAEGVSAFIEKRKAAWSEPSNRENTDV